MAEKAGWIDGLNLLMREVDAQVRIAALHAHRELMKEVAKQEAMTIHDCTIEPKALLPEHVLEPQRVGMKFDVFVRENSVSFTRGRFGGGVPMSIEMEWEARQSPEATALVRTKAESKLAKDIGHG